jgi:hypothetical protein
MTTAFGFSDPRLVAGGAVGQRGRPKKLVLNPFRIWKRHQRLERHALEEAQLLRRRHGALALTVAHQKLARHDLTQWGRRVLKRTVALLEARV